MCLYFVLNLLEIMYTDMNLSYYYNSNEDFLCTQCFAIARRYVVDDPDTHG